MHDFRVDSLIDPIGLKECAVVEEILDDSSVFFLCGDEKSERIGANFGIERVQRLEQR